MKTTAAGFAAIALVTLGLGLACDRTPTTPSASLPQTPQEPTIIRVEVIAPRTLAPGATAQLNAIAHRSDGTTQDITATVSLQSSSPDVLTISPDGMMTALKVGESMVGAFSGRYGDSKEVVVVPEGTFRVVGRVSEADTPSVPVPDARLEVNSRVAPVVTDGVGLYRLYGVPGNGRLRVTKSGYVTKEVMLAISDHHTEDIALTLAAPRLQVTGTYQLTIEANPQCRGQIPDALLTRRYTAEISQNGALIEGHVSGATFAGSSNRFGGQVDAAYVHVYFSYDYYYAGVVDLVEIVDEQTYLVLGAGGALVPAGRGFTGLISGSILIYDGPPVSPSRTAKFSCTAAHRLLLTR